MSESAVVYEVFRRLNTRSLRDTTGEPDEVELREIARRYGQAIEMKRQRDRDDRRRWDHWIEVERVAHERAAQEAEIASRISARFDRRPERKNERLSRRQRARLSA